MAQVALLLFTLVTGGGALAAPSVPGDPVAAARRVLVDYDAHVRAFKLARGHNVTLQLDDPDLEANAAWRGSRLVDAIRWLREALDKNPRHPTARLTLAQLLGRRAELSPAADELEEQVKRHPADAASWNALGVASARAGRAARKLECYRRAIALDQSDASARANLCNALAAAGKSAEAIAAGQQAVALRPGYVYAWMNLGIAYGQLGDRKAEQEAYLKAVQVPADAEQCPFARFNLALCYEQEQAYDEAVRWYRDALRVGLPQGPRSRQAALFHHNLARALYRAGQFPEAAREATEALKIDRTLPEPHSLLGHLFEQAGRPDEARRMYVIATRLLQKYGASRSDVAQRQAE